MPSHHDVFDPFNANIEPWRNGGHRGPMTESQKKAKEKNRKKKKMAKKRR